MGLGRKEGTKSEREMWGGGVDGSMFLKYGTTEYDGPVRKVVAQCS